MPDPLDVRIARAEGVDGVADAATEVEHAPRTPGLATDLPVDVMVGEHLTGVVRRERVAE